LKSYHKNSIFLLIGIQVQAARYNAALANIIPDKHILGSFFWGWGNAEDFNLNDLQAATVIPTSSLCKRRDGKKDHVKGF